MSTPASGNESIRPDLLVVRPLNEYLKLSFSQRWEVIRRHPYYQRWWRTARDPVPDGSHQRQRLQSIARLILRNAIQVEGIWPDPATSFELIVSHPGLQPFLGGTLAPLTRRAHLMQLILGLDSSTFQSMMRSMTSLSQLLDRGEDAPYELSQAIHDLSIEQLNEVGSNCIFSFNPNAPLDAIIKDFRELVKSVKLERNITETRRHPEKVNRYLEVWDAREGWESGAYRGSRIISLSSISSRLQRPLKTVSDQYRSAFKIIVGHDYTAKYWLDVVASWRWSISNYGVASQRVGRPLQERRRQEVPIARLRTTDADFLRQAGVTNEDMEDSQLLSDIAERIRAGDGDAVIYETLELSGNARSLGLVDYIRQQLNEL